MFCLAGESKNANQRGVANRIRPGWMPHHSGKITTAIPHMQILVSGIAEVNGEFPIVRRRHIRASYQIRTQGIATMAPLFRTQFDTAVCASRRPRECTQPPSISASPGAASSPENPPAHNQRGGIGTARSPRMLLSGKLLWPLIQPATHIQHPSTGISLPAPLPFLLDPTGNGCCSPRRS